MQCAPIGIAASVVGIEQTPHLYKRPTLRSIGLFLQSSSPHPHDLQEESAAARVPLLRTGPRGATLDPFTRSRTLDTARQAPGDLNANALPPMAQILTKRPEVICGKGNC